MTNAKNQALAGKILFSALILLSIAGGAGLFDDLADFPMITFVYASFSLIIILFFIK